ncbi:BTB/POZ and MATH domain-containing protein 2-like [Phragmites australis]|uniref:BTB/POZ and MATH domain-containing protein 2-like n=1 Tax=Phragmites australis TaxID=29695 RepID=UPI002D797A5D|nr:BTB/POZ and MATH domain-containing protein 2-like [Phragmites australis]
MSFAGVSVVGEGQGSRSTSAITAAGASVTDSGYHLLVVDGYSRIKGDTPNGQCIESQQFIVGGCRWFIEYYPNGSESEKPGYMSFFLVLDEEDNIPEPMMVPYEFSFIDQWGYPCFMRRKDLERSKHLKNDSFTIRCDVIVPRDANTRSSCVVVSPTPGIQQHLGSLLLSGEGADVTFEVGGETFMAHRCVLAARSSVFKAELFGSMKESTTTRIIRIDDMETEVFKLLLSFIYTDSVPYDDDGDGDDDDDDENAVVMWQHLFVAADIYDLEKFWLICEENLCKYINTDTVATILALAEQHYCQGLKEACLDFLSSPEELQKVMVNDGLDQLTTSCPSILKELITKLVSLMLNNSK